MDIRNTSQVQFKLYTSSLSNFTTWIESNKSSNIGTIFFLTQEKTIYLDGLYYGLGASGVQGIQSDIQALETWQSKIGNETEGLTTATKSLIQWVSELSQKFNGSSITGPNGFQGPSPDLDKTISVYGAQGPVNAVDAINKLAAKLNTLAGSDGAVTSVQGTAEPGKFVSNIDKQGNVITVTYTQIEDTNVKFNGAQSQDIKITGDNVQEGFQSVAGHLNTQKITLDGAQGRITTLEGTVSSNIAGVQTEIGLKNAELKTEIIGDIPEGFTGNQTVGGAIQKALDVESTLNTLTDSGQVAQNAQKIENLIAELRDLEGEPGDLVGTLIDKLEVLLQYANTDTIDSQQGYYRVNGHQSNTLQGIINELESKINTVGTTGAQAEIDAKINALDGTQGAQTTHIDVTVVQEDGKIKSVTLHENDIASAAQLETVGNQAATALTRLTWTVIGEPEPEP